ncbi:MAG: chemotaxis protein CheW [Pseudomonadota bacterium]
MAPTQYITFFLDQEEYALELLKIKEIIAYHPLTRVPRMGGFIKGILNLRGVILPVFDPREKFGLPPRPYESHTVILILELAGRLLGLIVDEASDVIDLAPEVIQPTPDFSTSIQSEYIQGIGTIEDRLVVLLNADRLLNEQEIEALDKTS